MMNIFPSIFLLLLQYGHNSVYDIYVEHAFSIVTSVNVCVLINCAGRDNLRLGLTVRRSEATVDQSVVYLI